MDATFLVFHLKLNLKAEDNVLVKDSQTISIFAEAQRHHHYIHSCIKLEETNLLHFGMTALELTRMWSQLPTTSRCPKLGSNQLMMMSTGKLEQRRDVRCHMPKPNAAKASIDK